MFIDAVTDFLLYQTQSFTEATFLTSLSTHVLRGLLLLLFRLLGISFPVRFPLAHGLIRAPAAASVSTQPPQGPLGGRYLLLLLSFSPA